MRKREDNLITRRCTMSGRQASHLRIGADCSLLRPETAHIYGVNQMLKTWYHLQASDGDMSPIRGNSDSRCEFRETDLRSRCHHDCGESLMVLARINPKSQMCHHWFSMSNLAACLSRQQTLHRDLFRLQSEHDRYSDTSPVSHNLTHRKQRTWLQFTPYDRRMV